MQLTAARFVCVQAHRILDTRLPVMPEDAILCIQNHMCDTLRQRRSVNAEHVLLTDALVPAAQQEAWIVNVMVKVMVREEQAVDPSRMQSRLHQLVSSRRPAIKHQLAAVNISDVRRTKPRGRRGRCPGTEDAEGCVSVWHAVELKNGY